MRNKKAAGAIDKRSLIRIEAGRTKGDCVNIGTPSGKYKKGKTTIRR